MIAGEHAKLMVAQFKLSYSRVFTLCAYRLQTHEMLFDAHNHAFEVFGGVPKRGIHDNMKTAVDKVGRGKVREVNARFRAMASHFLFEPEFCNPAAGWEKAQIEKNVQDALWRNNTCRSDCGARHLRHTHERIRQGHTRPPGRPRARPDGLARPMLSDAP